MQVSSRAGKGNLKIFPGEASITQERLGQYGPSGETIVDFWAFAARDIFEWAATEQLQYCEKIKQECHFRT